jgi:hypothetical protein
MRTAFVAALLLGSALAALAQEPAKATLEAVETSESSWFGLLLNSPAALIP